MKKITALLLCLITLFSFVQLFAVGAAAANYYRINGVTVCYKDFTAVPEGCWTYANNIYRKIWGHKYGSYQNDPENALRNRTDKQLLLTPENLKKYVSHAELGASLRLTNSDWLHSSDGWGHNQIIVQKDENGFTVFEGGLAAAPHRREKYYTWESHCRTWKKYTYIKYLKWPGATLYYDEAMRTPEDSFTIEWDEVEGATGYRIFVRNTQTNKWDVKVRTAGKKTSYTFDQLPSGSKYTFAVRAYVNTGSKIIWNDTYQVVRAGTLPVTTKKIVSTAADSGSVTLSWDKVSCTGYRVFRWNEEREKWSTVAAAHKGTEFTVTSLEPGKEYTFAVRPYVNTGEEILWSRRYTEYESVTAPADVSQLLVELSSKRADLSWSSVKGADGYRAFYYDKAKASWIEITTTEKTACSISLSPGTSYVFSVKAYTKNENGKRLWADNYCFFKDKTLPEAPETVTASSKAQGSIEISWQECVGADGYRIFRYNEEKAKWSTVADIKELSYSFTGLQADKEYTLAVRPYMLKDGEQLWAPTYTQVKALADFVPEQVI